MPLDLTDDKSTLVQVMACCRQATSHNLSQCWPRSMSPNGVTRSTELISCPVHLCTCVRSKFLTFNHPLFQGVVNWYSIHEPEIDHFFYSVSYMTYMYWDLPALIICLLDHRIFFQWCSLFAKHVLLFVIYDYLTFLVSWVENLISFCFFFSGAYRWFWCRKK